MITHEQVWLSIIRQEEEGIIITLMGTISRATKAKPREGIYYMATIDLFGKTEIHEITKRATPGDTVASNLCLFCTPESQIPGLRKEEIGPYYSKNFEALQQRAFIEYQNIWLKLKQRQFKAQYEQAYDQGQDRKVG